MQTIFVEPLWTLSQAIKSTIQSPPAGYKLVAAEPTEETALDELIFSSVAARRFAIFLTRGFVPGALLRAWRQRHRKLPEGIALTYAFEHVVFRHEPWVVEVDCAHLLLGAHPQQLKLFHGFLERRLASPYCRKIICYTEATRRSVTSGLRTEKFEHKIELVPVAVPPKHFFKEHSSRVVKLFFIGSSTHPGSFDVKGGGEVLEAFATLRQRYNNLELVFRSDLPSNLRARYANFNNLRIIDEVVPWETIEREFQTADICVLPSHATAPQTILDAMSYELPVVSRNCWANPEYVLDGKTGLLVQPSRKVPYYYHNTCHPNFNTVEFRKAVQKPDDEVVSELVQKLSLLIENPELRRRLGRAGRWEVEKGRFSIETRNAKLERIFDEAIG